MPGRPGLVRTTLMQWRRHPAWAYILVVLATLFWAGNVTLGGGLISAGGLLAALWARRPVFAPRSAL